MLPKNMGPLLAVYKKELLEVSRDRKTLMFMLVLPLVLIPLLMQLTVDFVADANKKAATETLSYAVFGADNLPGVEAALAQAEGFERVSLSSEDAVPAALADEEIKLALVVPPPLGDSQQTIVELHYDNASVTSRVQARTRAFLDDFGESVRADRLTALGVTTFSDQAALIKPVVMVERGTASVREKLGEVAGGLLPYMVIPFCFLGALYPAIDLGAGEKERGTLETLLLAPVSRLQLVLGKFLVVFTTGLVSATLSLVAIGGWVVLEGVKIAGELGEVVGSIGTLDLALVWLMLVPTTAMFSAVLLSISIYAKSFKEAQSFAAPFNMLCILPAVAAMLPGVTLSWGWALVPVSNISLAIKELLKGTMDYTMLVAILGSSTVIAAALLVFCTRWFSRESVLFRQ
ncbi:MAG: ABC transporter permease [Nannocystaceae bacterium]|nr:ABC transporter permease [Nannocystaceae bacterium]